ncbi:hypothetical protein ACFYOA_29015 [Streptomyces iakyrus]|uniref:hypothetical protein n=1 Tax=Streptomyces iakyrus TaxID=68219 RepID=UPI0036C4D1BD
MDFNRRTATAAGLGAMVAGGGSTARAAAPMTGDGAGRVRGADEHPGGEGPQGGRRPVPEVTDDEETPCADRLVRHVLRARPAGRGVRADGRGHSAGDAPPPHGYRLGRRTRMTVDVCDFDDTAHRVTVSARPVGGGWTVRADQGQRETSIRVPAGGRAGVNFTALAGSSVPRRIDRRLAFRAAADDHAEVPATVALIHRG